MVFYMVFGDFLLHLLYKKTYFTTHFKVFVVLLFFIYNSSFDVLIFFWKALSLQKINHNEQKSNPYDS